MKVYDINGNVVAEGYLVPFPYYMHEAIKLVGYL